MEPIRADVDGAIAAHDETGAGGGMRLILALAGLVVIVSGALYFWWQRNSAENMAAPPVVLAPPAAPPQEKAPPILHPVEEVQPAEPLPALDESDDAMAQAIAALVGRKPFASLFLSERIVRRIVATVDNLPRREAPVAMWPVRPAGSWLDTAGKADDLTIGPKNAVRYAPFIRVVKAVDAEKLAAGYRQFYPLFQQAYRELGYPDGYFNDRLVVMIDDLLATPEPKEPLRLVQVKVRYQFADPDLDRRSAGQKILLRMGVENAHVVKAKLREFRQRVAKQGQ